jgi:uncharacterized membrane protein
MQQRFWELDFFKGIAIILVVVYHFIFDLYYFFHIDINIDTLLWQLIARSAAALFIIIAGINTFISTQHSTSPKRKILKRTSILALLALIISVMTWFIAPQEMVVFGILHFLALAGILGFLCAYLSIPILCTLAIALCALNTITTRTFLSSSSLIWLGLTPPNFTSLDYFPCIPWFGIYVIGIMIGKLFYKTPRSLGQGYQNNPGIKLCSLLGRKTLLIYLAHQPIILCILFLYHYTIKSL